MFGLLGVDLNRQRLIEIRAMSEKDRSSAIWEALAENYGPSNPFYNQNQADTAFDLLKTLALRSAVDVTGSEIKSIIKMAKKCW
jgi:hypothetical protein